MLKNLRRDFPLEVAPVLLAPLIYSDNPDRPMDKINKDMSSISSISKSMVTTFYFVIDNSLYFHNFLIFVLMSQMDPSLADLVMEMGYSICSSLEECRRNLLSVISGNNSSIIFGPLSIAKVLSMMIRTYTRLDSKSNLTYWPGDNANHDQEKNSSNCTTWNVDVFVHTVKELVLIYYFYILRSFRVIMNLLH